MAWTEMPVSHTQISRKLPMSSTTGADGHGQRRAHEGDDVPRAVPGEEVGVVDAALGEYALQQHAYEGERGGGRAGR